MKTEPLNPYESPQEASLPQPLSPRKQLIARLRGPSIGLLVLSGLQAGYLLMAVISLGVIFARHGEMMVPITNSRFWGEIGWAALWFIPSAFIFVGACHMRYMRSLHICRAAAVVACIPFLSPVVVLGIPLGIWAAVVLFQKRTAEEFGHTASK